MIQALRLTVAVLLVNFSTSTSVIKIYNPRNDECTDELNLKYTYGEESPETQYNRTCFTKCTFEKEGKIDAEGNLVASAFSTEEQDAAAECWNIIKEDDLCKKVETVQNCIYKKTDDYWKKYTECEKYNSFTDNVLNNCFTRCQLIVDRSLNADGSVNLSSIVIYQRNSENTATEKEAVDLCKNLVNDKDTCTKDLNMYYCISHIMYHWSLKVLKHEIQCAKEHNVYPFYGATNSLEPRNCYDRCVLVKNDELNADDILESKAFKTAGMSEEKIKEAYSTCKKLYHKTDKCTTDLYFYDCINYLQYASPDYLEKQIECALESKSTLVQFRQEYKENYCNTKCIMIKDGQIDENGQLNKTQFEQTTIDNAIIEESIKFCEERFQGDGCDQLVFRQYCTNSKINDELYQVCNAEETKSKKLMVNPDESYYCSSRCYMIHGRQLDTDGNILIEPLVAQNPQKSAEDVEEAIKHCKAINEDTNECAKDVNIYYCVTSELWKADGEFPIEPAPYQAYV